MITRGGHRSQCSCALNRRPLYSKRGLYGEVRLKTVGQLVREGPGIVNGAIAVAVRVTGKEVGECRVSGEALIDPVDQTDVGFRPQIVRVSSPLTSGKSHITRLIGLLLCPRRPH